ncbi:hypothetical protein HY632_01405 [Candidatus Uhrbacteria bacterium]|nr:hypothetical protein [Candidatus Uhrbacteria bacterium]
MSGSWVRQDDCMRKLRNAVLVGAMMVFGTGAGYVVYYDRPIMRLPSSARMNDARDISVGLSRDAPEASAPDATRPGVYTAIEVATHASPASCWTSINGSVYDLTGWIARHPGGPSPITGLCGTDGTEAFTRRHGTARVQQQALALLKIGALR